MWEYKVGDRLSYIRPLQKIRDVGTVESIEGGTLRLLLDEPNSEGMKCVRVFFLDEWPQHDVV